MADNILEIKDLVIEYHTDDAVIHALNGVSLTVRRGETIGLVGETGAGKTTIAKSIMRILQVPPAKYCGGSIVFDGQDVLTLTEKEMRKIRGNKISMIFQDPMTALNPVQRIGDQIAEAVSLHNPVKKAEAKLRAVEMLEMVGIPAERYGEYPHQFSGGMKQRVVIAMALACNPTMLLADEPTTALDVTIQAQILNLMNDLKKEHGTSILFVTHDLGVINQMADDVAVMYCGQVVELTSAYTVFSQQSAYSHPYTEGLMVSIPRLDTPPGQKLEAIPGAVPHPLDLPKGCKFAPRCKYCTEKCREEEPALEEVETGHQVRCFYPDKEERHGRV